LNVTSLKYSTAGTRKVCDLIAEQPFFRGLSGAHLRTLGENARQTWFESGELIFKKGDLANRFYLILEGRIALETSAVDGQMTQLQIIGAGELLGWPWVLSPYIYDIRARALEPSEAIFFYGTRLLEQCETDHDFGYEIFKRLAEVMMQRLRATRRLLLERKRQTVALIYDWRPGQH
jgi:CRP-like cAMP-binding protein